VRLIIILVLKLGFNLKQPINSHFNNIKKYFFQFHIRNIHLNITSLPFYVYVWINSG